MITTQECPFHCPFCLERQNPMSGDNDFEAQIEALKRVLSEHPDARLSITGGEPGLYPEHIAHIVQTYKDNSNNVFCSINTTGFNTELNGLAHINLSATIMSGQTRLVIRDALCKRWLRIPHLLSSKNI